MATKTSILRPNKQMEELPRQKKPKKPQEEVDESNWLISYADLMTLLVAFFAMMFSMSKLNAPQYERVKEQLAKHFGGDYKSPPKEAARFFSQVIQELGVDQKTLISSDHSGVTVILHSSVFFDTLGASLTDEGKVVFEKVAGAVSKLQRRNQKDYRIIVEGHTDSRPIVSGTFPTNWELSSARASTIVRLFLEKGFLAHNLLPVGFAHTRPKEPERTPSGDWDEEALAENRRVVLRVLEPNTSSLSLDDDGSTPVATKPAESK